MRTQLKLTGSPCHTCESRYPVVYRVSGFPLPDQVEDKFRGNDTLCYIPVAQRLIVPFR